MQIFNKKDFLKCPNGTVFALYTPDLFLSDIRIKTGYYKSDNIDRWNGELLLLPFRFDDEEKDIHTQWCTVDNSDADYKDNDLFAIFSKTEVIQMINCLMWALTGCTSYFNQDLWFLGDGPALTDKEMEI